jgi:hypothetical protein
MHEQLHFCCRSPRTFWVGFFFPALHTNRLLTCARREPNPATDSLTPHLLLDSGDEGGLCIDFLNELHLRFDEDETVKLMITKSVINLSSKLSQMTMNDEYKLYVNESPPILLRCNN